MAALITRENNISGCPFQLYALSSTKSTQFVSNRIFGNISYRHIHEVIDCYWDTFKKSSWWNPVERLT